MKVSSMRAIDRYAGMPLSFLILFYEKSKRFFVQRKKPGRFNKILVMKFFGMGSTVLATPLLSLIRKEFQNSTIGFLTFEQNRDLMILLGVADRCYFLRTDTYLHFVYDTLCTILKLRRDEYDAVIDLEFFSNFSMTMSYLSAARWRIGYYVRGTVREYLLDYSVYFNQSRHVTEVFLMLASGLGNFERKLPVLNVAINAFSESEKESLFRRLNFRPNGNPVAVLNVNASELCYERRWPADRFLRLAEHLRDRYRAQLVFIGAGSDAEYVAGVIDNLSSKNDLFNLSGRLTLRDLVIIFKSCSLFITNDSGPLHLASALGVPTVSFFGPETPRLYGPVDGRHLVFYKGIYCSPCLNVYNAKTAACNGYNLCMREIGVEDVIEKIAKNFTDILLTKGKADEERL